jgi:hypothetical protein
MLHVAMPMRVQEPWWTMRTACIHMSCQWAKHCCVLDDDGALALSYGFVRVQCLEKTPDLRACVQTMLQARFHSS